MNKLSSNKPTALITGAASGIGLELSKLLIKKDYHLIMVDINQTNLKSKTSELEQEFQTKITSITKDLGVQGAAEELFDEINSKDIKLDVLINNAGFGTFGPFWASKWEREEEMINLHIHTITSLTKLFLKGMVDRGYGKIMNVSSMAAFQPGPLMSVYYATKAYINSFSEAIAYELKGTGVTVTSLCPGVVKTGFQSATSEMEAKMSKNISLAADVAKYGYNAMMKGKSIAIPGRTNSFLIFLQRFIPRKTVMRIIKNAQIKNRPEVREILIKN